MIIIIKIIIIIIIACNNNNIIICNTTTNNTTNNNKWVKKLRSSMLAQNVSDLMSWIDLSRPFHPDIPWYKRCCFSSIPDLSEFSVKWQVIKKSQDYCVT